MRKNDNESIRMVPAMRLLITAMLLMLSSSAMNAAKTDDINPVPFTQVHITDKFWSQRLDTLRSITIRYAFKRCEQAGQLRNFEYAGKIVSGKAKVGELTFQSGQPYDDAEVYKVLEGASYLLKVKKDAELEAYCDGVVDKICSAQEPDGYLQTNYTIHNPLHPWYKGEKWKGDWDLSHETFNVGELIESAIAYYQATGKRKLLNCAIKAADNMCGVFNDKGIRMAPGHAVVEMALVRLYELTRNKKYLNTCKFFIDCRGVRKFDPSSKDLRVNGMYWQDHLPAVQQRSAVGHAVRALYFYSGIADWVRYSGDQALQNTIDAIWQNIASKKMYVTGGFGARHDNEAFGEDYELPNANAYCETCASVAGTMFNERMFRLHGDSKYIDMLERALYNTVLDGYSVHGTSFYYPNALETSRRGDIRSEWFGTSCCPTNLCRLIPSVPGYVYATNEQSLYLNLFVNSTAEANVGRCKFTIKQTTEYPYSGKVTVSMLFNKGSRISDMKDIRIRIPGWAVNKPVSSDLYSYVNPTTTPVIIKTGGSSYSYQTEKGYAIIPVSELRKGDVEIILPMDVHQVKPNDNLTIDKSLCSYERGPLVYCAEGVDNNMLLDDVYIPSGARYSTSTALQDLFRGGVEQITASAVHVQNVTGKTQEKETTLTLIPYFARSYRTPCSMKVWIANDASTLESAMQFVDRVMPCDDADEKAHNLKGENMNAGPQLGWRDARGGFISYDMKVDASHNMDVVVKLWGSDSGNRRYDVLVDGKKISSDVIENNSPGRYYYKHHAIPAELTRGKESVNIRFQSVNGSVVGGLFGVYTVLSENK